MSEQFERRVLFEKSVALSGLAILLAACAADPVDLMTDSTSGPSSTLDEPSSTVPIPEIDPSRVEFARPWESLIDAEMTALGVIAYTMVPEALDHARKNLATSTAEMTMRRSNEMLAQACQRDVDNEELVVIDGWLLPKTLAGLAMALSQIEVRATP